ncbi:PREDICTED: uncharacterized protein LOC106747791 isoform X2 [Dinoponera quadriceps]|nr:PREDICTED: uncharacterized protein LOC106747791 isoform X2 [Dinoponera quadriceps]
MSRQYPTEEDAFVNSIAFNMQLTTEEVQECFNKTSITPKDIMHVDRIIEDDLHTIDSDDRALKMGCFTNCLFRKKEMVTGTQINFEKVKEMRTKVTDPDKVHRVHQTIDTCADQVKSITNECEVGLKFVVCYNVEIRRLK